MTNYGKTIAKLRKQNNLTQEKLGNQLGVSYQAVSKWENNLAQPDLQTIEKMSEIFNISISVFFDMCKNDNDVNNIPNKKQIYKQPWFIATISAVTTIIIATILLCVLLIPSKKSREKIYSENASAVFKITASYNENKSYGTGFFISENGLAVT